MTIGGFRRGLAAATCAALAIGLAACAVPGRRAAAAPGAARRATFAATVTAHPAGPVLGQTSNRYIGLSFESGDLNSGRYDNVGNLPQLMRNLGRAVMRFGGNSVDTSYYGISQGNLAGLVRLATATGWTVLFSENLGHFDASEVTSDARAVSKALGGRLFALACGNEPDIFTNAGLRAPGYSWGQYESQESRCLTAIRAGAPHAPIEGPDTANDIWLTYFAAAKKGSVRALGQHFYPMGCGLGGRSPAQFDATLLSPGQVAKEAAFLTASAKAARTARAPLRLTETNTACNGGAPGASNTYATALWAVDYLLTGTEHGVSGFNFHTILTDCGGYTPLCEVGWNTYAAQPLYYGLLFTHLLGIGKLVPATVAAPRGDYLTAFALKPASGDVRLMVENLTGSDADVTLRPGGNPSTAAVLRLTGPSLLATGGVRIQGAAVAGNGTLTRGRATTVSCAAGRCQVTLPPYSAALVTFR